jgi:hypothetical protein
MAVGVRAARVWAMAVARGSRHRVPFPLTRHLVYAAARLTRRSTRAR